MKRTLILVAVLGVSIGTFGVAVHAWRRVQAAETEREAVRRQIAVAEQALQAAEARRAAAAGARREAEAALADAKGFNPAAPAAAPAKKSEPVVLMSEQLEKNPEVHVAALRMERGQLGLRYGAYFRLAGLAPEQVARFTENALRKQERILDLQAVMSQKRLTWADPAVLAERKQAEEDYQAAQRALLGDAGYRTLHDYERTTQVRDYMAGWAGGAVVMAGQPFTPEQGERLVQIMVNASESHQRGGHAFFSEPEFWQRVDGEAKKILTPAQFEYFTRAEPPLPRGGRYQTSFYRTVQAALKTDKDAHAPVKP